VAAEPGRLRSPWMLALTGKEPVASRPPQEGAADNEPGRVLIVADEDRVRQLLSMMVAEEGQRPVQKGWRDPDLTGTIGERFRMVVLDWGSAPRLAARLAGAIRASQRETPIAVLVPCWSDLEVGAREAADFFFTKPLRVTEIRRVLALTFGSRSRVVGRASEIPMGAV
jgi:DNA-binding response OmpR family regulator